MGEEEKAENRRTAIGRGGRGGIGTKKKKNRQIRNARASWANVIFVVRFSITMERIVPCRRTIHSCTLSMRRKSDCRRTSAVSKPRTEGVYTRSDGYALDEMTEEERLTKLRALPVGSTRQPMNGFLDPVGLVDSLSTSNNTRTPEEEEEVEMKNDTLRCIVSIVLV